MKTPLLLLLGAVLLTACHHRDGRDSYRLSAPADYRSHDDRRRSEPRRYRTDTPPNRLHRPQGFLPPVGMRWDCPTEPQMLGYVTR